MSGRDRTQEILDVKLPAQTTMPNDIDIYCNCMERVRRHVHIADSVFAGKIDTRDRDLNAELIFLHFRKALEEIAFASVSANREKYSAARAGFATEWNARRMLGFVEKVNPNFYPIPLKPPHEIAPGHKFFDRISDGFLTKDDFVTLYDGSSEVLHCRNPYAPGDPTINVKYSGDEWSRRIKLLLCWHFVQIVDVPGLWVIQVPDEGPVRGFFGPADGAFVVEPPIP
jgi:hypothetical protein